MRKIRFRSLMAAVERWDVAFYDDPPLHERFVAACGEYGPDQIRQLLVDDVVPWIRIWPAEALAELEESLGFLLLYEGKALGRMPSALASASSPETIRESVWETLFAEVFGGAPAAVDRSEYEVVWPGLLDPDESEQLREDDTAWKQRLPPLPEWPWMVEVESARQMGLLERNVMLVPFENFDDLASVPSSRGQLRKEFTDRAYRLRWVAVNIFQQIEADLEIGTASWSPPGIEEWVEAPARGEEHSSVGVRVFGGVYGPAVRLSEVLDHEAFRPKPVSLEDFAEALDRIGIVLGLAVDLDEESLEAQVRALERDHGLPHQPWRSWWTARTAVSVALNQGSFLRFDF